MNTGGIAQKLIDFAKILVGRIPGGLAHTNILGNTLFGSLSGSSVAASVAIGGVLIPMEEKEGYDKKFAAAVNIASAPTGLIIPPSGILIIYPVLAGCSVVGMIMSGYIPGLMWALACMAVAYVIAKKNRHPQPAADRHHRRRRYVRHLHCNGVRCRGCCLHPVPVHRCLP